MGKRSKNQDQDLRTGKLKITTIAFILSFDFKKSEFKRTSA